LVDFNRDYRYDGFAQVGWVCAPSLWTVRKVRTPQGRKPGNPRRDANPWIGPQKHTAREGKGEMAV